ncbi:MAG: protein kinase [Planctomycetes bacterium]|nr:protein kinase [Planctomycetota bacterium]
MSRAGDSAVPDGPRPDFGLRTDFYTFAPEDLARDLPQFLIEREVGKGSMGIVYAARLCSSGERIALKILPPSLHLTERTLARFLREGQLLARVQHPDITRFLAQGQSGRLHWFAMEFVDGTTLQERLQVGPLPVRQACAIAARVARALQYAHDQGVVHRDIKPSNLMLRREPEASAGAPPLGDDVRVAITDFGLARETASGSLTDSGAIVGTPMYMAPEQVLGGSAHSNSLGDVYSLGATLYALVTGAPPFDGPTAQSVLKAVLAQDPVPPERLRRDLPAAVAAIIGKAMEREPSRRYGSAQEFAEDLERCLRGERVQARSKGPWRRLRQHAARHPFAASLGTATLILGLGAFWLMAEQQRAALEQELAETARLLAIAATSRDEADRPRPAAERRDLLLKAVASASSALRRDRSQSLAWFLRGKAHLRLLQGEEAVHDLDQAEQRRGSPSAELLQCRIDALRLLGDAAALRRVQHDLATLLQLDPGADTRARIAEYLLDLAAAMPVPANERREALQRARVVLAPVPEDDPRSAVLRARLDELSGDVPAAIAAMRLARSRHQGNLFVHLQAAALFDRVGLYDEGAREHEMAAILQPGAPPPAKPTPVDLDGLGNFLGDVDRLMQALTPAEPGVAPQRRQ